MDLTRRYFITDTTKALTEDVEQALNMCIGKIDTQRYSVDKSKLFVKTTQSVIDKILMVYPHLTEEDILNNTFSTEYTLDQIQLIMNTPEWTAEDDLV